MGTPDEAIKPLEEPISADSLRVLLEKHGCARVQLRQEADALSLAQELGHVIKSPRSGELVEPLIVMGREDATHDSMSSRFGADSFPFHTDQAFMRLPARYIFLYHRAPISTRPTTIIRFKFSELSSESRDYLTRGIWAVNTGRTKFFAPVVQTDKSSGRNILRYDPCIMTPVCSQAKRAAEVMSELITKASCIEHLYKELECLIFDNWMALHGRGSGSGDEGIRTLMRISVR